MLDVIIAVLVTLVIAAPVSAYVAINYRKRSWNPRLEVRKRRQERLLMKL